MQKYLFKHILHDLTPITMNAHYSNEVITFYLYIISELQFYISFNILLDNEVMQTSKRRSFLPLIFIIKCISKHSLIRKMILLLITLKPLYNAIRLGL